MRIEWLPIGVVPEKTGKYWRHSAKRGVEAIELSITNLSSWKQYPDGGYQWSLEEIEYPDPPGPT